MIFLDGVGHVPVTIRLHFGGDPDPEICKRIHVADCTKVILFGGISLSKCLCCPSSCS